MEQKPSKKLNNKVIGNLGEKITANYLKRKGFQILGIFPNFRRKLLVLANGLGYQLSGKFFGRANTLKIQDIQHEN